MKTPKLTHLVIRRRSKKLGDPRRRGIDGDLEDLDDRLDAPLQLKELLIKSES